jgi:predicted metal-binding membrane protein
MQRTDRMGDRRPTRPHRGGVLVVAGAFQFSSLKHRCLTACRAPTSFLYRYWRGDNTVVNAAHVGAAYGLSCAGCCWALMLVMFALGAMSPAAMVVFGSVTAIEKSTRFGRHLTTPLGIGLVAVGAIAAIRA